MVRRVRGHTERTMRYNRCCVDCTDCVDDLDKMIEDAVEVTYRTMHRNCVDLYPWAKAHNYGRHFPLKKDWHVSYYRSKFKGEVCYFLVWSGIEYIWTESGSGNIASSYGARSILTQERGYSNLDP